MKAEGTEGVVEGDGWGILYDERRGETHLVLADSRARGETGVDSIFGMVDVVLPEELADLICVAWENRPRPAKPLDLRAAVLSIFVQSRWGAYSAAGVWNIAHGTPVPCVDVIPNIGAATAQDIATACEGLVGEGLLLQHRVHNHVTYELVREKFPVED